MDKFKNVPSSLSNLKIKVDKLDVDKLVLLPVDIKKLIDAVDKQVLKKYAYDEIVKNVNTSKTSDLANKAYSRINEIEKKNKKTKPIMIMVNISLFKNEISVDNFAGRLKQANIGSKNDIIDFVKRYILIKN